MKHRLCGSQGRDTARGRAILVVLVFSIKCYLHINQCVCILSQSAEILSSMIATLTHMFNNGGKCFFTLSTLSTIWKTKKNPSLMGPF